MVGDKAPAPAPPPGRTTPPPQSDGSCCGLCCELTVVSTTPDSHLIIGSARQSSARFVSRHPVRKGGSGSGSRNGSASEAAEAWGLEGAPLAAGDGREGRWRRRRRSEVEGEGGRLGPFRNGALVIPHQR
jgi:hypothetical protein